MLKTINNIVRKDELLEIQSKIGETENKRRNYLDNDSKGDNVQRRAAILQIYNDEIQKLNYEYVKTLKEVFANTDLDNDDVKLFKSVMQDTNKTISNFITKDIKKYELEKEVINKIPENILINELERLVDEYLPVYAMQNVYNIPTGCLKGKSQNIYNKISYIANYYNLDVTIGQLLYSILELDISNKEKVKSILEVDKIIDGKINQYMNTKRQEFQRAVIGKDRTEQLKIAKIMEGEAMEYRRKLYEKEYMQRGIKIMNDKRILNSLK